MRNTKKLSNEVVDTRLIGKNIRRLDTYVDAKTPINFQCDICHHIWMALFNSINSGSGCPHCVNIAKRLTNEEIDNRLAERPIKRLSNYTGHKGSPTQFQCLIEKCKYSWKTSVSSVLNGKSGCPKCSGHLPLSNEIIDQRLENRPIRRISGYEGANIPMQFQCEIDGCYHIWKTSFNHINEGTGCPKCVGLSKLTNEIIDQRLEGRPIKRIGNYDTDCLPMKFQCQIEDCYHIWETRFNHINSGSGCPKCLNQIPLTDEVVDQRLKGRSIRRISEFKDTRSPMQFQCEIDGCHHIWTTRFNHINNGSGCPKCYATSKRLTNEEVDKLLVGRNIRRLADYTSSITPMDFQCENAECFHIWTARFGDVNGGTGCPKCHSNKAEKLIGYALSQANINHIPQCSIKNIIDTEMRYLRVDFYLPSIKTIIEYNGDQHYMPIRFGGIAIERAESSFIKQQERDQHLQIICDQNDIALIWIDGRQYRDKKLEIYLVDVLVPQLKTKLSA
jgi:transcription initiation factor IIE alpha subunit